MSKKLVSLVAALALAACDEAPRNAQRDNAPASPAAAPGVSPRIGEAQREAEERLRARLRLQGPLMQRAVAVHRQALGESFAVCGQINTTGRGEDPYIPYVAVIGFEAGRITRADLHFASTPAEATRVYFEMVDRCFDGGGPATPRAISRPMPPAPLELPRGRPAEERAPRTAEAPAPMPVLVGGPFSGSALTRQAANIRSHPTGSGSILRVAPGGQRLTIFSEAPGGWYQVGEGSEPWGWVHASMLER
jgi:hypothetical protein